MPEGHPDAGTEITKPFKFPETETDEEAREVMDKRKLSVKKIVDKVLRANARSAAYQAAMLPYKASEVPKEDIAERMVRDYIRMGKTEEWARRRVAEDMADETGNA